MRTLRALRRRIRTVDNTKQITRAMKSVSASKMRRTEGHLTAGQPYARSMQELVTQLLTTAGQISHPLVVSRPVARRMVIVVTADRGLCGAFNASIIRRVEDFLDENRLVPIDLFCIGKRGRDYFRRHGCSIVAEYIDLSGRVDVGRIKTITRDITDRFLDGRTDEVYLAYNKFISVTTYRPIVTKFLPVEPGERPADKIVRHVEYIFEPDVHTILESMLPRYLNSRMYITLAEAFTAEHSARMIAMSTASDNCEELIRTLTLEMNKARQASITKELLEIVSGAEALKG